jgi:large subunit ribosomal protein L24
MKKVHVRRDDTVIVISGDDKGVIGKVVAVSPEEGKVIVQGANIVSKHQKPRRQGEAGGILKVEAAMYASKVQIYCSKCEKGVRIQHKIVDGKKIRVCAKCGQEL